MAAGRTCPGCRLESRLGLCWGPTLRSSQITAWKRRPDHSPRKTNLLRPRVEVRDVVAVLLPGPLPQFQGLPSDVSWQRLPVLWPLDRARYPLLEVAATVGPSGNGLGFSSQVWLAGKPRTRRTAANAAGVLPCFAGVSCRLTASASALLA